MAQDIVRSTSTVDVTFTTSTGTTGGVNLAKHAGGVLYVSSGSATLTFYAKPDAASATAYSVYADGSAVTLAVAANRCYALPDSLFAAGYVMAVSSSGNVVGQLTLKG